MRPFPILRAAALAAGTLAGAAAAQEGAAIGFEGLRQDPATPIEVTADGLTVDQAKGTAVFAGNVVVVQGALRLGADEMRVEYDPAGTGIRRITATGGVTFATATDAAEAREAVYDVEAGALTMRGDVVLTQGAVTITGERLAADLRAGTGRMEGRVRTVFRPAATAAP
jgi:lipopolysaccharide export system protein LptA